MSGKTSLPDLGGVYRSAEQSPAGNMGMMILPYFQGANGPYWDLNARGMAFELMPKRSATSGTGSWKGWQWCEQGELMVGGNYVPTLSRSKCTVVLRGATSGTRFLPMYDCPCDPQTSKPRWGLPLVRRLDAVNILIVNLPRRMVSIKHGKPNAKNVAVTTITIKTSTCIYTTQ